MEYVTRADIDIITTQKELARLTDDGKQAPDEGIISNVIKVTNTMIDDALRVGGYNVPLQEVPAVIKSIAKSIAKYELYKLKTSISNNLQKEYDSTQKLLMEYVTGKKILRLETAQQDIPRATLKRQPRKSFFEDTDNLL